MSFRSDEFIGRRSLHSAGLPDPCVFHVLATSCAYLIGSRDIGNGNFHVAHHTRRSAFITCTSMKTKYSGVAFFLLRM